jgi:hypothetical protein
MAKAQTDKDVSDHVAETASTIERMLRDTIETKPYNAVAIALGLGWFFGRMHRPSAICLPRLNSAMVQPLANCMAPGATFIP